MKSSLKPHIVITDSDPAWLSTIKKLIESDPELKSYTVWTALNAVETISTMHTIDREAIFLGEYNLEDMNGFRLYRDSVRKGFRFSSSCCIVTSVRDEKLRDEVRAEQIGWEEKRKINLGLKNAESLKSILSQYRSLIKSGEKEIAKSLLFDPLTGCMTREHAIEFWTHDHARARREYKPIACIFADINDLKLVNDSEKGDHAPGDKLVKAVAEVLQKGVRGSFDYVARWGGDEFVIFLPHCDFHGGKAVVERLREEIASIKVETPRALLRPRVAFGVSILRAAHLGTDPDVALNRLIKNADRAMYHDKRAMKKAQ